MRVNSCMADNRKGEMRDNFANYNEHQLRAMQARSPWFNDKLIRDDELEEMEMRLLEKATKPIRLKGGGGGGDKDGEHRVLGEIRVDPARLFEEVVVVDAKRGGGDKRERGLARSVVLLHGIERGGVDHRALCQWSKLNETIDPFFQAIHYLIYTTTTKPLSLDDHQPVKSNDQATLLQNVLVASHFDPRIAKLDVRRFVDQLEKQLDVSLTRALLHRSLGVFLFEWFDAMPFCLMVACRLVFDDEHARTERKVRRRRRKTEEEEEGEVETIGDFLESHTTMLSREEVLMFYDATALEEDRVDEKKKVYRRNTQEKEAVVEQLALDERQTREIKLVLRNTLVSYITVGYAKRD